MKYAKWILLAVGAVLAYMVFTRIGKSKELAGNKTSEGSKRTQPGVVGDLLNSIGGVFGFGAAPVASPPVAGGYGQVGLPNYDSREEYTPPPADGRVPEFLQGATGGVADPAYTGRPPPPLPGIAGPPGTSFSSPNLSERENAPLVNALANANYFREQPPLTPRETETTSRGLVN